MKRNDLYWSSMVFMAVFLFAFGFAVTVTAEPPPPPYNMCCHQMCQGSTTDTSHYGYIDIYTGECVNGPGPRGLCDYRAFECSYID